MSTRRTAATSCIGSSGALLALGLLVGAPGLAAQARPPVSAPVTDLRFEVTAGPEQFRDRRLDVTVRFRVAGRDAVLLSMPAWTPGSYEIANYARHVAGFTARQAGTELRWDKLDPDTWRVHPERAGTVELRYCVRADDFGVAGSWTTTDFAFFNGTTLFLAVEGRLETSATMVVRAPADWRVATGMTSDDSTRRYRAADFHDLVDHPVFVGRFDLDSTQVQGKWMRLATWPEGSVGGRRRAAMWDGLARVVEPLLEVFGEVPWTSYTVLQAASDEYPGMAALEHSESELAVVGTPFLDEPFVMGIHAHEIAHAWNVKRLRPADLVPYRYDAAQPTPWLWVSEGITDYYADLALVRTGLIDETAFLEATLNKIESVANRPATALEDASLQAWLGMGDGTSDLYYDKGSLAGLALDILIRDASNGTRSLDGVMRELWENSWKKGRGFTHDDFWNAVARATRGRAFGDFERRYIDGREPFPWNDWLPRAGWRLRTDSIAEPRLGALLRPHEAGVRVSAIDPDGAGAKAGLRAGDVIARIGGRSTLDPDFGDRWRNYWGRRPGDAMPLDVRRGADTIRLTVIVETLVRVDRQLVPDPAASPRARRVRAGILGGARAP